MTVKIKQSNFDKLLKWIGGASENDSAEAYEHIRCVLIKIFLARGFSNAEDMTDAVFERVASKISEIEKDYTGEKINYFLSVAGFIQRESYRKKEIQPDKSDFAGIEPQIFIGEDDNEVYSEAEKKCLKKCFFRLKSEKQTLILNYYDTSAGEKKAHHKNMVKEKFVSAQALRIKIHRIKSELSECVKKCLRKK